MENTILEMQFAIDTFYFLVMGARNLQLNFWQEIYCIFSTTIKLCVSFLTPKTLNLCRCNP
jgi:hypothetical protein